jgi:hypothetical protein
VAREARRRGVPFAGHVFPPLTPLQASDSGIRSQEHLSAFPNPCTAADSVRVAGALPLQRLLLGTCTREPQEATYTRIARNGTWITPTLIVQGALADLRPAITAGDRVSAFYSDSLLALLRLVMQLPPNPPDAARAAGRAMYEMRGQLVVALAKAGVPLLIGTDAPLAPALPGEGVHEEMAILVRAGLTPAQALRAATWEPARYFSATDSSGTVAAGKVSDLVLLEGNPLADIGNTRRIAAVVARGRVFDRPAIDDLINAARVRR